MPKWPVGVMEKEIRDWMIIKCNKKVLLGETVRGIPPTHNLSRCHPVLDGAGKPSFNPDGGGGGTPIQSKTGEGGRNPIQAQTGEGGSTPSSPNDGMYPHPVLTGGTLSSPSREYPHPVLDGYPSSKTGWGTP